MSDVPESTPRTARGNGARQLARKLALQALYGWLLNQRPWQDLINEFDLAEEAPRADREYYNNLVREIATRRERLDAELGTWTDRPAAELDPIEHVVMLIGLQELHANIEVPFRVVISEAVNLARRFGATDGHKFVNAVMDRAARALRPHEH